MTITEDLDGQLLLAELHQVNRARGALEARMTGLVQHLRDLGVPWEAIGGSLQISRQAAQQRFSA